MEAVLCTLGYLSGHIMHLWLALVPLAIGWTSHINATLQDQGTALMDASERGHESVVKLLLDKKADPDAVDKVIPPYTHRNTQAQPVSACNAWGVDVMLW
jgi:ankyrin repeat protein